MASHVSLELLGHPLCPFTQRVLFVAGYKKLKYDLIEIDLSQRPKWLFEITPGGKLPALKVIINGEQTNLYDSVAVSEYFDSFPGPYLYPRNESGIIEPLKKAQLDMIIKCKIDILHARLSSFWKGKATELEIKQGQLCLQEFNDMLSEGYLMTHIIKNNQLTMADVMLFPFIERINALKNDYWKDLVKGLDLKHIWRWYEELTHESWISGSLAGQKRILKLQKDMRKNDYRGFKLPLTYYDSK